MGHCNWRIYGEWVQIEDCEPVSIWHDVSEDIDHGPEIDLLCDDYIILHRASEQKDQIFIGRPIAGFPQSSDKAFIDISFSSEDQLRPIQLQGALSWADNLGLIESVFILTILFVDFNLISLSNPTLIGSHI